MTSKISKEEAYSRLGILIRDLHEALNALGSNQLNSIIEEIPNARDRLAYVGTMTENAANKVLGLVEIAKPRCDELASDALQLGNLFSDAARMHDISVKDAREALKDFAVFARQTAEFSAQQQIALSDIMMAQDFQDLSGQVIQKVIGIITRTELQLMHLLVDSSTAVGRTHNSSAAKTSLGIHQLEGPQVPTQAMQQGDVDDLLASMGF